VRELAEFAREKGREKSTYLTGGEIAASSNSREKGEGRRQAFEKGRRINRQDVFASGRKKKKRKAESPA